MPILYQVAFVSMVFVLGIFSESAWPSTSAVDDAVAFVKTYRSREWLKAGVIRHGWLGGSKSLWYSEKTKGGFQFWRYWPRSLVKQPFFDNSRLKALLEAKGVPVSEDGFPFAELDFFIKDRIRFKIDDRLFELDPARYSLTEVPKPQAELGQPRTLPETERFGFGPMTEVLSPDRKWFATASGNNFALRPSNSQTSQALSVDASEELFYRFDDYSFPYEPLEARAWREDGKFVATIRFDAQNAARVPLTDTSSGVPRTFDILYWKGGENPPAFDVYVVDIETKRLRQMKIDHRPDDFLALMGWSPKGDLVVSRCDRFVKTIEIFACSPSSGDCRRWVTESSSTFVEDFWYGQRSARPQFASTGELIWISDRQGWRQLYLVAPDTGSQRMLTRGTFSVDRVVTTDSEGWVYFLAHGKDPLRPYDLNLFRVHVSRPGHVEQLTHVRGRVDLPRSNLGPASADAVVFSPDREYFVVTSSEMARPHATELRKKDGTWVATLSVGDASELYSLGWSPPEEFEALAEDGVTRLHGAIMKPHGFDPRKKYPVIDYVYNGPFIQSVPRGFAPNWMGASASGFAKLGFVVFMVDARGSSDRGRAFVDTIYENWGRHITEDHVATLRQVAATRPYMDLDRVGVFGGSYGGYMAFRAMVTAPDFFKVGVSHAPAPFDFRLSSADSNEPYLGPVVENAEAYVRANLLSRSGLLKGKVLITQGTLDVAALSSTTLEAVNWLRAQGKQVDYIEFPNEPHSAPSSLSAAFEYFLAHLK